MAEEKFMIPYGEFKASGDYQPCVKVENIEDQTEEEWLATRRTGIGGSDEGVVQGCNDYKTLRDLYYDKTGQPPAIQPEMNWVTLQYGHYMEPFIIELFRRKNPGWEPFVDRRMFYHRDYPFLLADCDAFVKSPINGEIYILEIKTASAYVLEDKWGKPDENKIPESYEWQLRHYMAVTGAKGAIICCLAGNLEVNYRQRFIERDLDIEQEMIERAEDFWFNNVLAGVEPPLTEAADLALKSIQQHFAAQSGTVEISKDRLGQIKKYLELKEKQAVLQKQIDELKKAQTELLLQTLEDLQGKSGYIIDGDKKYEVVQKMSQRRSVKTGDMKSLELKYPDAYNEFVTTSESVRTTVKASTVSPFRK